MAELIDKGALIDHMKSQWEMQELYLPVHFEYLVDEIPTTTEAEIRAKAISEFAEKLGEEFSEKAGTIKVDGIQYDILTLDSVIEIMWDLVEQLKGE